MTKILIDGPAWVGDMVMAQVLFKLLKQQDETIALDVMAPKSTAPLLACMPEVNNILTTPFDHGEMAFYQRRQFAKQLRASKYDQAIVLRNSLKSAFIPFWAKIPKRTGWVGECRYGFLNDIRKLDKSRYPLMIERFAALAFESGSELPSLPMAQLGLSQGEAQQIKKRFGIEETRPIVALCPGAEYGPSKRWPASYFAQLAQRKLDEGFAVWLFGSKKEESSAYEIQQLSQNRCENFVGRTSLFEAIYLMDHAKAVVSNDSGLMHIAAALQKPVVAIYGGSSYQFTPPLCQHKKMLTFDVPCRPCFKRDCQFGHYDCLKKITVDRVAKALDELSQ